MKYLLLAFLIILTASCSTTKKVQPKPAKPLSSFEKICIIQNSNNVTIDEYFIKHPEIKSSDRMMDFQQYFLQDKKYQDELSQLMKAHQKDEEIDFESVMSGIQQKYPACYDVLPALLTMAR